MKKKLYYIYLVILTALVAGCQDEAMFTAEDMEEEMAYVTYQLKMGDDMQSRAIGDGAQVDELKVGVFQGQQLLKIFTYKKAETENFKKVTIPLLKQETYELVFWAQKEGNGIYTIDETNFNITVNYAQYTDISLKGTEAFEAFTLKQTGVKVGTKQTNITLTRPFAQLNVAASEEDVFQNVNKVSFTISQVYTVFNPYTGGMSGETANQAFSYFFSKDDIKDMQSISIDNDKYYYLASAYMFAPETVDLQGDLYKDTDLVKELNVTGLPLNANTRTNIYGDMIQQEELPAWDGNFPPKESTLTIEENKYIIDDASDLAWLSKYSATLAANSTFLQTVDINMGSKTIESIQLPEGSIYDGGDKKIINYANSLFGDATKVSVKNLTVENAVVPTNGVTHVGVLMNTLSGSATFDNVIVTNSTATTTNGAAGGLVGYIKNNGTEPPVVNFTKCTATNNTVSGSLTTGVYVGRFRGYDNTETLTFSADCGDSSATIDSNAKASYYITDNAACWFTSAQTTFGKYSGWLGCEEYYRGTVNYGAVRYIPKWDGTTKIAPLTDGTTKLIYSAFDLANLQEVNGAQITFKSDVDMGTKVFEPIMTATKVYGKKDDSDDNYVIYNLKVDTEFLSGPWYGGAFIRKMTSGSIENITIKDANVSVKNAEGGEDAYASILVATIEGNNVAVKNVSIDGGYLKGINKIGGIAGYVSCNLQATNCIVSGLTIENSKTSNTGDVFNSYGEVGGLIGLIQGNGSIISSCQVNNCTLNVVTSGLRYNNRFIGTANPSSGQKIIIQTNCSATGNKVTNENKLKYGGFFGIGGKTFDLLGGYSLTLALQGGDVYYGTTKLK